MCGAGRRWLSLTDLNLAIGIGDGTTRVPGIAVSTAKTQLRRAEQSIATSPDPKLCECDALHCILCESNVGRVRLFVLVGVLAVVSPVVVGCSGGDVRRVSDACALLTREEVSTAVHANAQPGVLTAAMDETDTRICSFQVSGQLGTVLVYLGEGDAPMDTDLYRATEVRGHTYVTVWAQTAGKDFPEEASALALIAIHRASRE